MKAGILTFHDADNYGAVLQAYSLKKSLSNYTDCEIINYYNDYFHRPYIAHRMPAKLMAKLHQKAVAKKTMAFQKFRDHYLTCGSPTLNDAQLELLNDKMDLFISGSDQVWNLKCSGGKDCYFLPFVKDNAKKASYAASLGTDTPEFDDYYKELIRQFHFISMREGSGCTYVKDVIGRECVHVLDPTFLLKTAEWESLLQGRAFSLPKENYIVIYEVVNGRNTRAFARKLSKEKRMPVYCITASNRMDRGIKAVRDAGPLEWIHLIKNSAYVVTNSFHGLAFSLIFNKQFFIELLPNKAAANARILEMLDAVHLTERVFGKQGIKNVEGNIDYAPVNSIIDEARVASIKYIQDMLAL